MVLETGTTRNLISIDLCFAIGGLYPGTKQYMNPYGQPAFRVPCDAPSGSFDYTSGNHTAKISLSDSLYKDPESGTCSISFQLGPEEDEDGSVPYILGDSFLRGAYTVFEMDNANRHDIGTTIRFLPNPNFVKGKDAVPIIAGCEVGKEPNATTTGCASLLNTPELGVSWQLHQLAASSDAGSMEGATHAWDGVDICRIKS
jgi:hypothetical protein